eukprot:jgi/Chrzof1/4562/Cz14g18120.t1
MGRGNDAIGGVPTLKNFDFTPFGGFGSRGGVEVDFDSWASSGRAEAIKSGENPTGQLPIVFLGDKKLQESLAMIRLFSKQLGQYGHDMEHDYQVDAVGDASVPWRWAWVHSEDPNDKAYPEKRAHFYDLFEKLLTSNNASGAHVVGGKPSTADAIVFGQLFDDIVLHDNAPIQTYPKLKALYEAFIAQPKVLQWCKSRSLKAVL